MSYKIQYRNLSAVTQPFSDFSFDRPGADDPAETRRAARRKRGIGPADPAASPDFITALARGLHVLRCFTPGATALGNHELAALTGLPKPTISRITYTLTSLGYLRYDAQTGRYGPGYGVLALGYGLLAGMEIRHLARPVMARLAEDSGAAVALGVFDRDAMTYIEAIHSSPHLYLRLPVGHRVAMHSGMGRAYLAGLPATERARILDGLAGATPPHALLAQAVADYAAHGYCLALGDWRPGIHAVAVPFDSPTGEGRFVMSCGGPDAVLTAEDLQQRIGPALRRAVSDLSGAPLVQRAPSPRPVR